MEPDISQEWVPVASYDTREDKSCGGASGEYAALLRAIKNDDIDYMSKGRPKRFYVRREQAERFLTANYSGRAAARLEVAGDSLAMDLLNEIKAMCQLLLDDRST